MDEIELELHRGGAAGGGALLAWTRGWARAACARILEHVMADVMFEAPELRHRRVTRGRGLRARPPGWPGLGAVEREGWT